MHPSQALIPHALPPEWMPPGEGALDNAARQAEMTAMCRAPLADLRANAPSPQDTPVRFAVVAAVGLPALRPGQRSAATPAYGWTISHRSSLPKSRAISLRPRTRWKNAMTAIVQFC
jgi:hypothetical protein